MINLILFKKKISEYGSERILGIYSQIWVGLFNFKVISTKCFMMLTGTFREISE